MFADNNYKDVGNRHDRVIVRRAQTVNNRLISVWHWQGTTMGDATRRRRLFASISLSALILGLNTTAKAETSEEEIRALRAQVEQLTRTVNKLMAVQAENSADAKAAKKQANQAEAQAAQSEGDGSRRSGQLMSLQYPDWATSTATATGSSSASRARTSRSTPRVARSPPMANSTFRWMRRQRMQSRAQFAPDGSTPVGNFGWMPDISTNISYLGVRGFQRLPMHDFNFVYQFEAGIDISVTPGDRQDNSKLANGVNGALFSRNSYIGLASGQWGAIKIGKTDAPYKNSTAAFNPFVGTGLTTLSLWATAAATIVSSSARD